jgi:hypothetical protein
MIWLGKARFFNTMAAVVAVLAWITGTNHCLLGLMEQGQNATASLSHCPAHPKQSGSTHEGSSGMLACCQGLLSAHFELAKGSVPSFPGLVAVQLFAINDLTLPEAPRSILLSTECDTGPPWVSFFVRTVLRRSLPENAPPLVS